MLVRVLKQYIFTPDGRLNRARYIKYAMVFGLAMTAVTAALSFVAGGITGSENGFLVRAVTFVCSIAWFAGYASLMIQRLHDLNRPTWWIIGALIPLVNVFLSIYLLVVPGTRGYNRYGADPLR